MSPEQKCLRRPLLLPVCSRNPVSRIAVALRDAQDDISVCTVSAKEGEGDRGMEVGSDVRFKGSWEGGSVAVSPDIDVFVVFLYMYFVVFHDICIVAYVRTRR